MIQIQGINLHRLGVLLAGMLLLALPPVSLAGEEKATSERGEERESLEEEFSELGENDFPDLIGKDEDGELMDEFALLQEEDVVFIAAKHRQHIAESPSAVSIITREQIENTHCTDLVCLMRLVPEVDILRIAPMYVTVGARALTGSYGDKALVMVDGREINIELFGIPFWQSLPVHLMDIERIEIIRGPGSALYGANAHSMVVSIVTRKTKEDAAEIFLGAGEHDRSSLHLRVDQRLGDWRLNLSGSYETSGHWQLRDMRERELGRLRLRVDHQGETATSSLQIGLVAPEGAVYTGLCPTNVDAWLGHLLLVHQTEVVKAKVSLGVFDADVFMDLPLYHGDIKLGEMPESMPFFTSNLDTEVQLNLSLFEGNLLITGGNYRWLTLLSEANDPDEVHQHRVGVFVHDEQRFGDDLVLTGGVRFDYNNITPPAMSPRLAGVWRFSENQFLRLAFGQAFKKPSFFYTSTHLTGVEPTAGFEGIGDFFRNSVGNDELGNETMTSFETGYIGHFLDSRLKVEADAFFNLYRNTIAFHVKMETDEFGITDLQNSSMQYRNEGLDVNSVGGSVSVTYRIGNTLRLNASYTFRHSWYVSDPGEGVILGTAGKGERVLWEPAHLVKLSFHYLPEIGLRLGMALYGQSSEEVAYLEKGGLFDDMIQIPNPSYCFAGGFIAWRLKPRAGSRWLELGLRAYNVLSTAYRDLPAVTRRDGKELGGQLLGRRIFLFFQGVI